MKRERHFNIPSRRKKVDDKFAYLLRRRLPTPVVAETGGRSSKILLLRLLANSLD